MENIKKIEKKTEKCQKNHFQGKNWKLIFSSFFVELLNAV